MTYFGCACENVGKDVLVIKDNKVIGKGRSVTMRGDEWVGIVFKEGEVLELIKDFESFKAFGAKHASFRYLPNSGLFFDGAFEEESEKAWEVLGQTMIVDEFNFGWGIAPDHFKQVEGFAARRDEVGEST